MLCVQYCGHGCDVCVFMFVRIGDRIFSIIVFFSALSLFLQPSRTGLKKKPTEQSDEKGLFARPADFRETGNEMHVPKSILPNNVCMWPPTKIDILRMGEGFLKRFLAFYSGQNFC